MIDKNEILERMLAKTTKTDDGHWLFIGDRNDSGYGLITINGLRYRVHRVSAHIFLNLTDLDNGITQVNHKCEFTNCWNPEHIYVGTNKENGVDYMNSRNTCKNGHNLDIYGIMRKRYSWEKEFTRLKCSECDRLIRNKSRNKHKESINDMRRFRANLKKKRDQK